VPVDNEHATVHSAVSAKLAKSAQEYEISVVMQMLADAVS
jgi:hypothetical protein